MGVDFNLQFGMNVRKYQFDKNGSSLTASSNATIQQSKWDSSVWLQNKTNPFSNSVKTTSNPKASTSEQRQALWDRLESLSNQKAEQTSSSSNVQQTSGGESKSTKSGLGSLMNSIGSTFSVFSKKDSNKVDGQEALNKMEQASNAEDLKPAVDEAVAEQREIQNQEVQSGHDVQSAAKESDNAQKTKAESSENVNQSKETLEANKGTQEEAANKVQLAKDNLTNATQKVASAEQALNAAKSAATTDNPNTAAINKAQADLKAAQQEEAQAKKDLEAAEQEKAEADSAVEQSETQVKEAEQNDSAAAEQVKTTESKEKVAIQTNKETVQANKELTAGVEEGQQKLEQMQSQQPDSQEAAISNSPDMSDPQAAIGQGQNTGALEERDGQYYCNGYQVSEEQYNAAQSMDQNVVNAGFSPGSTTDVYVNGSDEPKTFTVQEGKYMVDGQEVDSNTFLQEYNSAKANEESGTGGEISLINDDYSKYSSSSSESKISANYDTPVSSSGSSSIESKNGTVDEDFKAKNDRLQEMELALLRSKSGQKIKK